MTFFGDQTTPSFCHSVSSDKQVLRDLKGLEAYVLSELNVRELKLSEGGGVLWNHLSCHSQF